MLVSYVLVRSPWRHDRKAPFDSSLALTLLSGVIARAVADRRPVFGFGFADCLVRGFRTVVSCERLPKQVLSCFSRKCSFEQETPHCRSPHQANITDNLPYRSLRQRGGARREAPLGGGRSPYSVHKTWCETRPWCPIPPQLRCWAAFLEEDTQHQKGVQGGIGCYESF